MDLRDVVNVDRLYDALKIASGGIITAVLFLRRNRLRTLNYTVTHYRIGTSNARQNMGRIEVTWEGNRLNNVWESRVLLENTTGKDLSDVEVTVYSGDETLILNEHAKMQDTPDAILWKQAFADRIAIPSGQSATPEQVQTLQHRREYNLTVFNRGETAEFVYQTTVPTAPGPSLWVSVRKEGIEARHQKNEPLYLGVPQRLAVRNGLTFAFIFGCAIFIFLPEPKWLAAVLFGVGVNHLPIGAAIYRVGKALQPLLRL